MNSTLLEVCESRPFKTRNADEFSLSEVFSLFVDPQKSLVNPFEFENNIVKGRMGSGKTMYLRANYAYYQYTLITSLLDGLDPIIPIYIKLSDYQNKQNPEELYNLIVLRIIRELIGAFNHLKDSSKLTMLHKGFIGLPEKIIEADKRLSQVLMFYKRLSAHEFTEKVKTAVTGEVGLKWDVFKATAGLEKTFETEFKNKQDPSIEDINNIYKTLLANNNGKILILFDEAGSINRSFFKSDIDGQSYFEILMNQLRTLEFARVKIAIYPQTVSDILTETRYGDVVYLQENIHETKGYNSFYFRTCNLICRYMENITKQNVDINDYFLINDVQDPIEQLINASNGNMRRLIQLMDLTMVEYYDNNTDQSKITNDTVDQALIRSAKSMEELYSEVDKDFLSSVIKACKARGTFNFQFPNSATNLYKFTNRSSEFNPINIIELGTGRRGTVYSFDYAFCVFKGIPTHSIHDADKIDRARSLKSGIWISKITSLSDELLNVLDIPGKLEGIIDYLNNDSGFIKASDGKLYYFNRARVIEQDRHKYYHEGKNVRFLPAMLEDSLFASYVEIS